MAIQVNDIYRVSLRFLVDGQECYNVLHARALSPSGTTSIFVSQALNKLVSKATAVANGLLSAAHVSVLHTKLIAVKVAGPGDPHGREVDRNAPGLISSSEMLPGFVAGVIRHTTELHGRSFRGRSHVMGLCEEHSTSGRLSLAGETVMTTVAMAFANNWLAGNDWAGVVFSPTLTAREGTPRWTDTFSYSWSPVLGSMYSRRLGIGS